MPCRSFGNGARCRPRPAVLGQFSSNVGGPVWTFHGVTRTGPAPVQKPPDSFHSAESAHSPSAIISAILVRILTVSSVDGLCVNVTVPVRTSVRHYWSMRLHPPRLGRTCGLLRHGTGLARCIPPWSAEQVQRQPYRALRLQYLPGGYPEYGQCQRRGLSSTLPHHCSPLSDDEAPGSTIFALSTAPGRAAIAVIRISGPACLSVSHDRCQSSIIETVQL